MSETASPGGADPEPGDAPEARSPDRPREIRGALDGIRVVNAGQIIAGPFTATLLAEFGADVIKVEAPANPAARTVQFAQDHRGQRGVTLNLRHADGARLFGLLCGASDVLVENFRPRGRSSGSGSRLRSCEWRIRDWSACGSAATGRPAPTATAPASTGWRWGSAA